MTPTQLSEHYGWEPILAGGKSKGCGLTVAELESKVLTLSIGC